jgi:hypothetical protein
MGDSDIPEERTLEKYKAARKVGVPTLIETRHIMKPE